VELIICLPSIFLQLFYPLHTLYYPFFFFLTTRLVVVVFLVALVDLVVVLPEDFLTLLAAVDLVTLGGLYVR